MISAFSTGTAVDSRRLERGAADSLRTGGGEVKSGAGAARRNAPASRAAAFLDHRLIVCSVGFLCLIGLPIVLSASEALSALYGTSPYGDFARQCLYMAVGLACAVVAARVSPASIRRTRFLLPALGMLLLVAVFLPGIGHDAGGSSRWIGAGPIQLQPSELMKLAVVVFGADLLTRRAARTDQFKAVVVPMLVLLGLAGAFILAQPDLGTVIVLCCITFGLMFAAGVRLGVLGAVMGSSALAGGLFALHATYRRERFLSFLHPFAHAGGIGYQVVQSLATLGMGGASGSGVGGSETPWGYLPNAHTDFVFAVVGGNLGVLGSIAVIGSFCCLAVAGVRVALREQDRFMRLVAAGLTVWIVVQAAINIGGVIDALPVTGIPLPFVSYGGSALIMAMTAAGILAGIARRQRGFAPAGATGPGPGSRSGRGSESRSGPGSGERSGR